MTTASLEPCVTTLFAVRSEVLGLCCPGWDMSGYRLQTLSPTQSEIDAAEAAEREARELGPDEPIVSTALPL
jgi:hypothetical protein